LCFGTIFLVCNTHFLHCSIKFFNSFSDFNNMKKTKKIKIKRRMGMSLNIFIWQLLMSPLNIAQSHESLSHYYGFNMDLGGLFFVVELNLLRMVIFPATWSIYQCLMCHRCILIHSPCRLIHIWCHVSIQGKSTFVDHFAETLSFQVSLPVSVKYFSVSQVSLYPTHASI
jgi:hypothetical protein